MKIYQLLSPTCGKMPHSFHGSLDNFEEVVDMTYTVGSSVPQRLSLQRSKQHRSKKPWLLAGTGVTMAAWFMGATYFSKPATHEDKTALIDGVNKVIENIENRTGDPATSVIEVNGQPFGVVRAGGNDGLTKAVTAAIRSSEEIPLVVVETTRGNPGSFLSRVSTEDICGKRSSGVVTLHSWWNAARDVVKSVFGLSGKSATPSRYPEANM